MTNSVSCSLDPACFMVEIQSVKIEIQSVKKQIYNRFVVVNFDVVHFVVHVV